MLQFIAISYVYRIITLFLLLQHYALATLCRFNILKLGILLYFVFLTPK